MGYVISFITGGFLGVLAMCLMFACKDDKDLKPEDFYKDFYPSRNFFDDEEKK